MTGSINSSMLLRDIRPDRLAAMAEEDYYWYLKSEEFKRTFLQPLGKFVSECGGPVLDVGCGEGWLFPFCGRMVYKGIDASRAAIAEANKIYVELLPNRETNPSFQVCRLEEYKDRQPFNTVVFGGILNVLVKPEHYVDVLCHYREACAANYLIVYDLQRLKTHAIEAAGFELVKRYYDTVDMPKIHPIKRARKILVYRC